MTELSSGWRRVKFGDVAINSTVVSVNPESEGFDRYILGKHIPEHSDRVETWGPVGDSDFGPRIRTIFQPDDVICTTRGPKLKVARVDFKGLGAHTNFYLRTADAIVLLQPILEAVVRSNGFQQHLVNNFRGSVNLFVNWSDAAKYEFALPPLEEQRRIAKVLQAAQKYESRLEAAADQARTTWLSALNNLCRDRRLEPRSLGTLLDNIVPGRSVTGSKQSPLDSEVAVLKVSAVDPMGFRPEESKVLKDPGQFMIEFRVNQGDLLMTRANTPALVGETCIVDRDYPNLMLCDKTLRLVPAAGINKRLLWHLMQSQSIRQQIASVATGTGGAMKNISQAKIRALKILFPDEAETAKALCETLDHCFEAVRKSEARCEAAKRTSRLLVCRVLEGPAQ